MIIGISNEEYIEGEDYTYKDNVLTFNNVPESIIIRASGYSYCAQYIEANNLTNLKFTDCLKIADYANYSEGAFEPQKVSVGDALTKIETRTENLDLTKVEPYVLYNLVYPEEGSQPIEIKRNIDTIGNYWLRDSLPDFSSETGYFSPGKGSKSSFIGKNSELQSKINALVNDSSKNYYSCSSTTRCNTLYKIISVINDDKYATITAYKYTYEIDNIYRSNNPGLYKIPDNYGDSYIYRGQLENNWVRLGDLLYRIIRINGDGSIRLMYSGTVTDPYESSNNLSLKTPYASDKYCKCCSSNIGYKMNPNTVFQKIPNYEEDTGHNLSEFPYSNATKTHESYFFNTFDQDLCGAENENEINRCKLVGYMAVDTNANDVDTNANYDSITQDELNKKVIKTSLENMKEEDLFTDEKGGYKYWCGTPDTADITTVLAGSQPYKKVVTNCEYVKDIKGFTDTSNDTIYFTIYYKLLGYLSKSKATSDENKVDSAAKERVDKWYEDNILEKTDKDNVLLKKYLADEIFCNNRTLSNGNNGNGYSFVIGSRQSNYEPLGNASLICSNKNDSFTTTDTQYGNGELTYPVGLITADEIKYAGAVYNQMNLRFWLTNYSHTMTISPAYFLPALGNGNSNMVFLTTEGALQSVGTSYSYQVRPVINLKSGVYFSSGSGTESDPYIVKLP